MLNIAQEIQTPDSEMEIKLLDIPNGDNDFYDRDDVSPHYNDGITDLESSIENLRKLLQIKEKNHELSSDQTIMNPLR